MIQVAFAGHNRAHDLGHRKKVSKGLDAAFGLLKSVGVANARLLSGLAPGADELAAAAWRRAGLGAIHAVFPFLDDPKHPKIGAGGLAETATWLDGEAAEAQGRNPHLKQTRMIVEMADLLVVVWTGEPARGAGGTADAVLCALELGVPVLWIKPADAEHLRLLRPEHLPTDFHFPEFREVLEQGGMNHVEPADPHVLAQILGLEAPPEPTVQLVEGWRAWLDGWLHSWLWKTYRSFRNLLGGHIAGGEEFPVPADLASQPGFQLLTAAYVQADRIANRLSAVHRSEQILMVFAMIAAASVGSAGAAWPEFKLVAVAIELSLGIAALMVWATASDSRQHELWGQERYLAERLRLERAGWALGVSLLSTGAPPRSRDESNVGRSVRRGSGLPVGRFDPQRVRQWGDWAMSELVQGQAAYHKAISVREHRVSHRIHSIEDLSFLFLFVVLVGYLSASISAGPHAHLPHWVTAMVIMSSVIVPTVAAATMALEAKLEFGEQSARSSRMAEHLDELAASLGPAPSFDQLQNTARMAMRLHMGESGHWREGVGRRGLFRA
jgi:hypothetical protein